MNLKRIVEETDTPAGRVFDSVVVVLILTSIATFSFETLPNLPPAVTSGLELAEVVLVASPASSISWRFCLSTYRWASICAPCGPYGSCVS